MEFNNIQSPFFQNTDIGHIKNESVIKEGDDVSFSNIYFGLKMGFSMNEQKNHSNDIFMQEEDNTANNFISSKDDEATQLEKHNAGFIRKNVFSSSSHHVSYIPNVKGGIKNTRMERDSSDINLLLEHLSEIVNGNSNVTISKSSQTLSENTNMVENIFSETFENNSFENSDNQKENISKHRGNGFSEISSLYESETSETYKNTNFSAYQNEKEIFRDTNNENNGKISGNMMDVGYPDINNPGETTDGSEKVAKDILGNEGPTHVVEVITLSRGGDRGLSDKVEQLSLHQNGLIFSQSQLKMAGNADTDKNTEALTFILNENQNKIFKGYAEPQNNDVVVDEKEVHIHTVTVANRHKKLSNLYPSDDYDNTHNTILKIFDEDLNEDGLHSLNKMSDISDPLKKMPLTESKEENGDQNIHTNLSEQSDGMKLKTDETFLNESHHKEKSIFQARNQKSAEKQTENEISRNINETGLSKNENVTESFIYEDLSKTEDEGILKQNLSKGDGQINKGGDDEEQTWTKNGLSPNQFTAKTEEQDNRIDIKAAEPAVNSKDPDEVNENIQAKLSGESDISPDTKTTEQVTNSQNARRDTVSGQPVFLDDGHQINISERQTRVKEDASPKQSTTKKAEEQYSRTDVKADEPVENFKHPDEMKENIDPKLFGESNISTDTKTTKQEINNQKTRRDTVPGQSVFLDENEHQSNISERQTRVKEDASPKQFIQKDEAQNIRIGADEKQTWSGMDKRQHYDSSHKGNTTAVNDLKSADRSVNISFNDAIREKGDKQSDNISLSKNDALKSNDNSRQDLVREKTENQNYFQWEGKNENKINAGEKVENNSLSASTPAEKITVTPHREAATPLEGKEINEPLETKVVQQIIKKAVLEIGNTKTEIKIDIKPESLGTVKINVVHEKDHMTARIVADTLQAKEILEHHLVHLKNEFNNSGLNINDIDVSIEHETTEHYPKQQEGQNERTRYHQKTGQNPDSKKEEGENLNLKRREEGEIDYYA